MKARILKVSLVLLVVAAAAASYYLWQSRYSASARVMSQVRAVLTDPDSARFQDVRAFSETNTGCGVVNARNRLGGYTGKTRFVVFSTGNVIFEPSGDDDTGTAEARLDLAKRQYAFSWFAAENCHDVLPK